MSRTQPMTHTQHTDETARWSFHAWLCEVDLICQRRLALALDDLPDLPTRDAFEDGASPQAFFDEEVVPRLREDFGELAEEALSETAADAARDLGADRGVDDLADLEDAELAMLVIEEE